MENTELILIRHGETVWNTQLRMQGSLDSDLSAKGKEQIQALGKWMKNVPFDHLYCSDAPRARKTAEAITCFSGHNLIIDQRLREKNLGIFEGLTSEEAREKHPESFQLFKTAGANYAIDQGESTQQLQDRALEAIEDIRLSHPQQVVLLVTHGGVVRVIMKHVLGLPVDAPTRFIISNTGMFRVVWKEKWIVAEMGAVPHLEKINNVSKLA
ncbi:MAG: Phosphoserine phosphatase 1 [Deltaproteobacteria bacterium]|jgi:probable phosphoglycerate mutase|nr:Phosphoserine phosphatase 1 [Deltaproteobacteria bacterium]